MSNQVVTIGYLKTFVNGVISVNTTKSDSYCPTYAELTGGTLVQNYSAGTNPTNHKPGIKIPSCTVGVGYTNNQLVIRQDLQLLWYVLQSVDVSASPTTISCCGGSSTLSTTAYFNLSTKKENGITTASTNTSTVITASYSDDKSYTTISGNKITFSKNSVNYPSSTSADARSTTITSTYQYSGVTKTDTVSITQNSNSVGGWTWISDTTTSISVSPSSMSFDSAGGSKSYSVTRYYTSYYERYDSCNTLMDTDTDSNSDSVTPTGYNCTGGFTCTSSKVSCDTNTGSSRTGTLTVTWGGFSDTCSLSQGASQAGTTYGEPYNYDYYLYVTSPNSSVYCSGGTEQFTAIYVTTWDYDWVTKDAAGNVTNSGTSSDSSSVNVTNSASWSTTRGSVSSKGLLTYGTSTSDNRITYTVSATYNGYSDSSSVYQEDCSIEIPCMTIYYTVNGLDSAVSVYFKTTNGTQQGSHTVNANGNQSLCNIAEDTVLVVSCSDTEVTVGGDTTFTFKSGTTASISLTKTTTPSTPTCNVPNGTFAGDYDFRVDFSSAVASDVTVYIDEKDGNCNVINSFEVTVSKGKKNGYGYGVLDQNHDEVVAAYFEITDVKPNSDTTYYYWGYGCDYDDSGNCTGPTITKNCATVNVDTRNWTLTLPYAAESQLTYKFYAVNGLKDSENINSGLDWEQTVTVAKGDTVGTARSTQLQFATNDSYFISVTPSSDSKYNYSDCNITINSNWDGSGDDGDDTTYACILGTTSTMEGGTGSTITIGSGKTETVTIYSIDESGRCTTTPSRTIGSSSIVASCVASSLNSTSCSNVWTITAGSSTGTTNITFSNGCTTFILPIKVTGATSCTCSVTSISVSPTTYTFTSNSSKSFSVTINDNDCDKCKGGFKVYNSSGTYVTSGTSTFSLSNQTGTFTIRANDNTGKTCTVTTTKYVDNSCTCSVTSISVSPSTYTFTSNSSKSFSVTINDNDCSGCTNQFLVYNSSGTYVTSGTSSFSLSNQTGTFTIRAKDNTGKTCTVTTTKYTAPVYVFKFNNPTGGFDSTSTETHIIHKPTYETVGPTTTLTSTKDGSNVGYTMSSNVNWITTSTASTTCSWNISKNTSTSSRSGTITLTQSGSNKTLTISVIQGGAPATKTCNPLFLSYDDASHKMTATFDEMVSSDVTINFKVNINNSAIITDSIKISEGNNSNTKTLSTSQSITSTAGTSISISSINPSSDSEYEYNCDTDWEIIPSESQTPVCNVPSGSFAGDYDFRVDFSEAVTSDVTIYIDEKDGDCNVINSFEVTVLKGRKTGYGYDVLDQNHDDVVAAYFKITDVSPSSDSNYYYWGNGCEYDDSGNCTPKTKYNNIISYTFPYTYGGYLHLTVTVNGVNKTSGIKYSTGTSASNVYLYSFNTYEGDTVDITFYGIGYLDGTSYEYLDPTEPDTYGGDWKGNGGNMTYTSIKNMNITCYMTANDNSGSGGGTIIPPSPTGRT